MNNNNINIKNYINKKLYTMYLSIQRMKVNKKKRQKN